MSKDGAQKYFNLMFCQFLGYRRDYDKNVLQRRSHEQRKNKENGYKPTFTFLPIVAVPTLPTYDGAVCRLMT